MYLTQSASQSGPATFQALNNHAWLVATLLDCASVEDEKGHRSRFGPDLGEDDKLRGGCVECEVSRDTQEEVSKRQLSIWLCYSAQRSAREMGNWGRGGILTHEKSGSTGAGPGSLVL